jgi:hypothetical protein
MRCASFLKMSSRRATVAVPSNAPLTRRYRGSHPVPEAAKADDPLLPPKGVNHGPLSVFPCKPAVPRGAARRGHDALS